MKYTLLELVQLILSSLDSDEVDDIDETTESTQVKNIVKSCYWDLITRLQPPEHYDFFQLEETGVSTPTIMTLDSDLNIDVQMIKYDWQTADDAVINYQRVNWCSLADFLDRMHALDYDDTTNNTTFSYTTGGDTFTFCATKFHGPRWYAPINDRTVIFDSYDSEVEDFLSASKTMVYGKKIPTFTESNSFTPDLDAQQFSLLLNEAKSQAFVELKQTSNPKAEQRARGGWVQSQKTKRAFPYPEIERLPNYGRK